MTRRGDDGFTLDWPIRDAEDQGTVHSSAATRLRWTEARPTSSETTDGPRGRSVVDDLDSGRRQFRVRLRNRPAPIRVAMVDETPDEVVRLRSIVAELRAEVDELRHQVRELGGTA